MTSEAAKDVKCIEVGNWYSEYECRRCGEKWVQNDDAPTHVHKCATVLSKGTESTEQGSGPVTSEAVKYVPPIARIECDCCGTKIRIPGALVFSPPHGRDVVKYHVCTACWGLVFHTLKHARSAL
jgi:hypothetical protein